MIVFTGGGTGGHIFPAIEIARMALDEKFEVAYLGSLRGQESSICEQEGIRFKGFPSEPVYSLKSKHGLSSNLKLIKASRLCQRELRANRPDAIFSTGGYSAAPVLMAAHHLKIPYVIHESNSIPGRTNRTFAKTCFAFTSVFHKTKEVIPHTIRTGQPIRRELISVASNLESNKHDFNQILVTAGSQGSEYLNKSILAAIPQISEHIRWIHVSGPNHYEVVESGKVHEKHLVHDYLDGHEMAEAYRHSKLVIARSGGTLAELARFRLPSILVPLPTSADDHQNFNAKEFEDLGAAKRIEQKNLTPDSLKEAVEYWMQDSNAVQLAKKALEEWDIADSNERVWSLVKRAATQNKSNLQSA